jgi:hypothetical protein
MSGTVMVSAGHSTVPPVDPGATANGHVEALLALELRDMVASRLRAAGITVVTDGADGLSDPLIKAIQLAKKATVAVEIHWNSHPKMVTGVECLAKEHRKPLAKACAGAVAKATGLELRGEAGWKPHNSGHHKNPGFCRVGGVILELCYIHNPDDMTKYLTNKDKVADLLAEALAAQARKTAVVEKRDAAVAPAAKPQPAAAPFKHVPLRRGSRGASVREAQQQLRALAYDVSVNEDFDTRTERAVRAFQRSAGLEADGVIGRQTHAALFT